MEESNAWEKVGLKTHNGVNVPLFSLISEKSCGIGEFTDLIPLISWCKEVSFDVIQLLPLNDTGQDSSPYSAISAFALNPIHLGLESLTTVEDSKLQELITKLKTLNSLKRCDYKAVQSLKEEFLRRYYETTSEKIKESEQFKLFKLENPWLETYGLFKTLRRLSGHVSFENFPPDLQNPDRLYFAELVNLHEKEIQFYTFVQYLCFNQLENVKKIANSNGVFLMGDIPILINRDSADVWAYRPLFNLNYSAGAPPDMYAEEGQNWGFPTYNWTEMESEEYRWWKLRLKVAANFYDIYRIDHIVGFFRIWSIPYGLQAKNGRYIPDDFNMAMLGGEKIVKMMLESSNMLPIGEDLGNVPNEVRLCMNRLKIAGTKVMRWERLWNEDRRFILEKDYPVLSLTTVSTHDSESLKLWWKKQTEEAKDYAKQKGFPYVENLTQDQLMQILKSSLHTASLFHINLLQEYLSLIPAFNVKGDEEERINLPGTVTDQNWSYRFPITVEEIVKNQELKEKIRQLLTP